MDALSIQQPRVRVRHSPVYELSADALVGHSKPIIASIRVSCTCGWVRPDLVASRNQARDAFRNEHSRAAREADRQTCRVCCERKPRAEMARSKDAGNICKKCLTAKTRAWASQHRSVWDRTTWASHLRRKFGITHEQYDAMLVKQGGRCAICRVLSTESPKRFHVDHNHATGVVRGLLCYRCNTGLGVFLDDISRLKSAIKYLKEHQS